MLDGNYLLLSLLISSIGFVLFMYGKKQQRPAQFGGGMILMIFPYFVQNLLGMSAIALIVIGAVWGAVKAGI